MPRTAMLPIDKTPPHLVRMIQPYIRPQSLLRRLTILLIGPDSIDLQLLLLRLLLLLIRLVILRNFFYLMINIPVHNPVVLFLIDWKLALNRI
jgi:hypothetical protein